MQQVTQAHVERGRAEIKRALKSGDMDRASFYAGIVVHYRIGLGEIQVKLKHPAKALRKI
jgi:hypothetical protein